MEQDVRVQLRIGRPPLHRPRRRVPPRRREATRRRIIGTTLSACPIAVSTARSCATSIPPRSSGLARAHTALTDFGAENVQSIAPTALPLPPTRRNAPPVAGLTTAINERNTSGATAASGVSTPIAAAPLAPSTQRPGASTLSPSRR